MTTNQNSTSNMKVGRSNPVEQKGFGKLEPGNLWGMDIKEKGNPASSPQFSLATILKAYPLKGSFIVK